MPIIKSAKKKMRHDKKVEAQNEKKKQDLKSLIKKMRKSPSAEIYKQLTSTLDKAVKTNLIHLNKAGRLKSRLSKILTPAK